LNSKAQPGAIAEHDFEPVPGLPAALPEGEYLLWQGRPDARDLSLSALHVRKLAVYFALLIGLRLAFQWQEGVAMADTLGTVAALAALAIFTLGLLGFIAWLLARASQYTVTNRRVVIRCGVTVPVTVNLPFVRIQSADIRLRNKGYGDIALKLESDSRASWIMLWPHVRSWQLGGVQPMLRALPDAQAAGERLAAALRDAAGLKDADGAAPRVVRKTSPARSAASATGSGIGAHA
jgi:hypothetical protein